MTVKRRITAIRLADKIRRNPEYANRLGLKIEDGRNDRIESQDDGKRSDLHEYRFDYQKG